MTARIFISYRTSDGMDKATALGRDLGAVFGDEQVFIDKSDLRGGVQWRQEVREAIEQRPVVLLLLTPLLLGAVDEAGALRIHHADDPVRRELEAALEVGAQVIPVLCDGVEALPDTATLPAAFQQINERTWRRLRAYDWPQDVQRLVQDLTGFGVPPLAVDAAPPRPPTPSRRALGLVAGAVLIAGAALVVWNERRIVEPAEPAGLSGEWLTTLDANPAFTLVIRQQGEQLTLTSSPVAIAALPEWQAYRRSWRERSPTDIDHIVYRGEGTLRTDPGMPASIDVALRILSQPGDVPVDSGNLSAAAAASSSSATPLGDVREMRGRLWSNGDQADRPVVLRRAPR